MDQRFTKLKTIYGSHLAAAKALGVTRRTYLTYRKSGQMPEPMEKLVQFILQSKEPAPEPAPAQAAANG